MILSSDSKVRTTFYSIKNSTKKVLLSLLWSHFRISSTDSKELHKLKRYTSTLIHDSIIDPGSGMVTVSIIQFNSLQFCPESSFAAFQSISPVKDSSRLECVPRDFLLSVFCAKWKWEMKNITTFPKNGHTSKNTGSIMVTLDRYRKYT